MTQTQLVIIGESTALTGGKANPIRGKHFHHVAKQFLEAFPLNSIIDPEQFDAWAQKRGLLNVPLGAPTQSDAWKAHLQRRHELRYKINLAGTHPRMLDDECTPFTIDKIEGSKWEVRAPQRAVCQNTMAQKIAGLCVTKRKQLRYLLQSSNFESLPPYEKIFAETLMDDLDNFEQEILNKSDFLKSKFSSLSKKLQKVSSIKLLEESEDA